MKRRIVASLLAIAALTFASVSVVLGGEEGVKICHATGSGFNLIPPSTVGVAEGHIGHQDGGDIIPPFGDFAGQNWTAEGQAIWNNDCVVPGVSDAPTTDTPSEPAFSDDEGGLSDAPTEPNTSSIGGTSTSGPADGAWLLVVALGVLLASVVVMTPARAKTRR